MSPFSIVCSLVAVTVAVYFWISQESIATTNYKPIDEQLKMEAKLSALVVGATGEVGKAIVKELVKRSQFEKVTLLVRRHLDLPSPDTDENYRKVDQKVIDFENLSESADAFKGYQIGFSALGTTRAKSGAEGFYRVDHDYVVETAKLAKQGGCQHFHLVSSGGANKNSYFLYPKTKGEAEEDVSKIGFERLSIYRPNLLLVDRVERRTGEAILQAIGKTVDIGRWWSIDVPILTRAIVDNCFRPLPSDKVEILSNSNLIKMGKESK